MAVRDASLRVICRHVHTDRIRHFKVRMSRLYLLLIGGLLLAFWAQWRLSSTYRRWNERSCASRPLTGAQAAREILDAAGLNRVGVERVDGHLTDHYDPATRTLRLSRGVHDQDSLAAIGIAAHEAGHAIQHQELYWPMRMRQALLPATRLGARLSLPLLGAGLILRVPPLVLIGLGLFLTLLLFQLVTLPLEFDASRRAARVLRDRGLVSPQELVGVREVLRAAGWTYVAAFTMSFAQLLRLLRWGR
jgi:uncharacterized protein